MAAPSSDRPKGARDPRDPRDSRDPKDPKDPKVVKLERQLNLVSYLLSARAPVPFSDIRAQVAGFDDGATPDAVEKRFDRDKAELRAIGVEIDYTAGDPYGRAGYQIDKQGYFLPELELEPEDAMLLAVLQRALGVVDDPLGRNLKSALAKLTIDSQLPEPMRASVAEQHLLTLGRGPKDPQRDHLEVLGEAVSRRRTVRFRYRTVDRGTTALRTVQPYGLGLVSGNWHLVGFDEARVAVRNFRLDRVQGRIAPATKSSGAEYEVPEGFDLASHVGVEEFEIDEGGAPTTVVLETDEVATWLLERRLRGAGRLERRPDGTGTYEVEVRSEDGLLRWLAEFGRRVRIVSPRRLAESFRERVRAARALYEDAPSS